MSSQRYHAAVLGLLALASSPALATEGAPIGSFTAVEGNVYAARPGANRPVLLEDYAPVLAEDAVETQLRSRAKALLQDDTLIALGEDSRLQVLQHTYEPQHDRRTLILRLSHGRVRVLVGRRFGAPGSRVELQTPVATVSATEGAFVAWVEAGSGDSTGVTNIGRSPINFSAAGQIVTLISGQSSTAVPRRPPTPPELVKAALPAGHRTIADTHLRDRPVPEPPRHILLASGGPTAGPGPSAPTRQALQEAALQAPGNEPPMIPLAPPAVISGALGPDAAGSTPLVAAGSGTPPAPVPVVSTPPVSSGSTATGSSPSPSAQLTVAIPSLSAPSISLRSDSGKGGRKKGGKGKDD